MAPQVSETVRLETTPTLSLKCTIVGPSRVGKTHMVSTLKGDAHPQQAYAPTVCVDLTTAVIRTSAGSAKLQIWDTGGDPKFQSLTQSYYRNVAVIFLLVEGADPRLEATIATYWATANQLADPRALRVVVLMDGKGVSLHTPDDVPYTELICRIERDNPAQVREMFEDVVARVLKMDSPLPSVRPLPFDLLESRTEENWSCLCL